MLQSSGVATLCFAVLLGICQHVGVEAQTTADRMNAFEGVAGKSTIAYERLAWATSHIGHRLTGSVNGARAEAAADSIFHADGLDTVYSHPFEADAWSRGSVKLTIGDGKGSRHMACVALANTPLDCSVEATLVDAGNGLPVDLERIRDRAKGAVLLVNIGLVAGTEGSVNLHRSEKASLAQKAGAIAIVFVNQVEGHVLLTGTASIDGKLISVPAACIATEDGVDIRAQLADQQYLTARLEMHNTSDRVVARNIIAELRGTEHPDEVIIVGGHLDSWDLATGATDNGLGSFSILDLARVMASMPFRPQRTVRFVLLMGEEQGLLGSRDLVSSYTRSGEIQKIRCMINLDMSGNPQGFGVAGPGNWHELVTGLCQGIRSLDSASFEGRTSSDVWLHSDHQPFLLAGVPVLYPLSDLGKHVYGCYHSNCDDIQLVEPKAMTNNVRFVGALVIALAAANELPEHFTPENLRTRLIDAGLEGPLRIGGDWPWN